MLKRGFDLLGALLGLMLLAPVMVVLAVLIKLDSPGPVFFRQERIGRRGQPFRIHKFRTMVCGADEQGLPLTVGSDARITRIGRLLRERRLDELPQLIDVLQGTMSLVGPRPEVPRYVDCYPPDLKSLVLSVRPGITDPAALAHVDEAAQLAQAPDPQAYYIERILPAKLRLQADYVRRAGLLSDLIVIAQTLGVLLKLPARRAPLVLLLDAAIVAVAWQVTYLFRLGFERWISARPGYDGWVLLGIVLTYAATLAALRLPRGLWRYTSFPDIRRLALAAAVAGAAVAAVVAGGLQLQKVPRAVLALHPFVTLMGWCAARLLVRMLHEHLRRRLPATQEPRRALILGAGESARRLIAGVDGHGWQIVGLLDDNPRRQGQTLARLPILGAIDDVAFHAQAHGVTHLLLAMPSVVGSARRRVIEKATQAGLPILTVPSAQELMSGVSATRIRDIEPDDLLGRESVQLDEPGIAQGLRDRVVAVTGAGGSIGSQLCQEIARFEPAALVLIESSEFALYRVEQTLRERWPELPVHAVIADVKDAARLRELFEQHRPALVFHAAAYKHVPLVEVGNARAALHNNALGTWSTAAAAQACGVERFVLISTDKAVNPTNVMGATKRLAEMVLLHQALGPGAMRAIAVRFGNVLGSSGSVIPRFKAQIARGGPITVTHPDIIRYFMTISEACRLVLQAAAIGHSGQVLVLDMGEPVKIVDLARSMVRLSGHQPEDIPIVFTGLRPGEKLYEELLADAERTVPTPCASVRVACLDTQAATLDLNRWRQEALELSSDDEAVRRHLQRWVPEYRPISQSLRSAPRSESAGPPSAPPG